MSTEEQHHEGEAEFFISPNQPETQDAATPDCAEANCHNLDDKIHRLCHEMQWPPGRKVLVCNPDGYCCNCHC